MNSVKTNVKTQYEKNDQYVNKAGYTATTVACGWAGAVFEVTKAFGHEQRAKDRRNIMNKVKCDGRTDGRMDGQTKRGVESSSSRLKI